MPSANAAAPPGPPVRSVTRTCAPAARRAEGRRRPGRAESDHDHVRRVVPGVISPRRTVSRRSARALHPPCGVAETVAVAADRFPTSYPRVRAVPARFRPSPAPPPELDQVAPGWSARWPTGSFPDLTTWRLTGPDGAVRFAKVASAGADRYPTLRGEAERMVWAAPYLPVPKVVAWNELDDCTVLLTEALPGRDATDPVWRATSPGSCEPSAEGAAAVPRGRRRGVVPLPLRPGPRLGARRGPGSIPATSATRLPRRSTPT
jgi:hypothetical protein